MSETSHTQIVMWTIGVFFSGLSVYSVIFWFIVKGLKTKAKDIMEKISEIEDDTKCLETKLDLLDKKKVELIVYLDDKEAAQKIITTLQTKDRCEALKEGCQMMMVTKLDTLAENMDKVLNNQRDFAELKGMMSMVIERQKHVIERIDTHMNGHSHKEKI